MKGEIATDLEMITLRAKSKYAAREQRLLYKYGITIKEYNKLYKKQGGVCAICRKKQKIRCLAVDHDHTTARIRRLLCIRCNWGLSRRKTKKYIEYVKNHQRKDTC